MLRYLLLGLTFLAVSCNNQNGLPVADNRPKLSIFCNATDVSCIDLGYITEDMDRLFGENSIVISYIFVDSPIGEEMSNTLGVSDIPSFLIFNADDEEIYRLSGEFNIELIEQQIRNLLGN